MYQGITIEATGNSGINIKNNIVWNLGDWAFDIKDADSISAMDNNCWYRDGGGNLMKFDGTIYDNFATYQAAVTPLEVNSINADPLFANEGGTDAVDYKIVTDSPCKDAGADVSLTEDYFGNPVPYNGTEDMGAHEYAFIPKVIITEEQ